MISRATQLPLILASLCLAMAVPSRARGDDNASLSNKLSELSIEELLDTPVVGAAKREQAPREVAASVTTVTSEEIDLLGYRNLADVLRAQRSFYQFTDGLNWMTGVRGFLRPGEWNARILLLVDGRPTRDVIYGQTHLDQDFVVPVEAIKRVEIIRGPGSTLYGSNAVFGVVNVVTKDGADLNGGGLVRAQGGTHDTGRVAALWGTKTAAGWDIMGSFAAFTTEGDTDVNYDGVRDAEHNFGHIRDADHEGARAAFIKVRKGDFTGTFDLAQRDRDNRSATYLASFFDPGHIEEDKASFALRFDREIAPGHSVHALAYYAQYRYDETDKYDADPSTDTPAYRYVCTAHADWFGQEVHYDWQVNRRFHALFGADATQAIRAQQRDSDDFGDVPLDTDNSYNAWALFAEAEVRPTEWLTLVAGLRLDRVQRIGTQLSPRAAALVMPTDHDTFKLMYGRAFRQPNLYEFFYDSPGYVTANPDLKPEAVDTYELVWERRFASGWHTSVGGFVWKMSDALDDVIIDEDGVTQTQNIGSPWARGVEVETRRIWNNGARFRAHASYTRAEDDDGDRLALSPEWLAGASISVPVIGRNVFVSIESQFVGSMLSDAGVETDPSYLTNVVLTARDVARVEGLDFHLGIYNIFAGDSRLPSGGEAIHFQPTLNYPPTQAWVGLTYRF
jgi:outer membrane receptor for ferrienterochelin and colicins